MKSSILIAGCGALGTVLAVRLARAGHPVSILARNATRANLLNSQGLTLFDGTNREHAAITAHAPSAAASIDADMVCICVKSQDTAALMRSSARLLRRMPVVISMQNGHGNTELLTGLRTPQLVGATPGIGSTRITVRESRLAGIGITRVAPVTASARAAALTWTELLSNAGLSAEFHEDFDAVRWSKLVINAAINPITAINSIPNGVVAHMPELWDIALAAAHEAAAVARAQGITLLYPDIGKELREVCRATAANRSSMLQDMDAGRPTEIDAITGAIIALGRTHHVPTPVNIELYAQVGEQAQR